MGKSLEIKTGLSAVDRDINSALSYFESDEYRTLHEKYLAGEITVADFIDGLPRHILRAYYNMFINRFFSNADIPEEIREHGEKFISYFTKKLPEANNDDFRDAVLNVFGGPSKINVQKRLEEAFGVFDSVVIRNTWGFDESDFSPASDLLFLTDDGEIIFKTRCDPQELIYLLNVCLSALEKQIGEACSIKVSGSGTVSEIQDLSRDFDEHLNDIKKRLGDMKGMLSKHFPTGTGS